MISAEIITVIHVFVCLILIGVVLLQQGQGSGMGATFGGGGGNSVFGASGADSFLTRFTTGVAVLFFITSVSLAIISKGSTATAAPEESTTGIMGILPTEQKETQAIVPSEEKDQVSTSTKGAEAIINENAKDLVEEIKDITTDATDSAKSIAKDTTEVVEVLKEEAKK